MNRFNGKRIGRGSGGNARKATNTNKIRAYREIYRSVWRTIVGPWFRSACDRTMPSIAEENAERYQIGKARR